LNPKKAITLKNMERDCAGSYHLAFAETALDHGQCPAKEAARQGRWNLFGWLCNKGYNVDGVFNATLRMDSSGVINARVGDYAVALSGPWGLSLSGRSGVSVTEGYGKAKSGYQGHALGADFAEVEAGDAGIAVAKSEARAKSGNFGLAYTKYRGTSIAGDNSIAISGDYGNSVSGDQGVSIAGPAGLARSGCGGTSVVGQSGYAMTEKYGCALAHIGGTVSGDIGSTLILYYYDQDTHMKRVKVAYVGEDGILPNTIYKLNENLEFVATQ